jgi:hypothetical protein
MVHDDLEAWSHLYHVLCSHKTYYDENDDDNQQDFYASAPAPRFPVGLLLQVTVRLQWLFHYCYLPLVLGAG